MMEKDSIVAAQPESKRVKPSGRGTSNANITRHRMQVDKDNIFLLQCIEEARVKVGMKITNVVSAKLTVLSARLFSHREQDWQDQGRPTHALQAPDRSYPRGQRGHLAAIDDCRRAGHRR